MISVATLSHAQCICEHVAVSAQEVGGLLRYVIMWCKQVRLHSFQRIINTIVTVVHLREVGC